MVSPATTSEFHQGKKPGNYGQTYPPEALSREEIKALIDTLEKKKGTAAARNTALVILLYRTGLRISEALDLTISDVDFVNHAVSVLRGKGGKRRTVGMDGFAEEAMKRWLEVRKARIGAPVFCTRDGDRMYATYFRAALKRAAAEAGIEKRVHPHMLRHTFAAELAREGVPVAYIQRQLGHSSLTMTLRYLSTLAPTEVIDAIWARPAPWETDTEESVSE